MTADRVRAMALPARVRVPLTGRGAVEAGGSALTRSGGDDDGVAVGPGHRVGDRRLLLGQRSQLVEGQLIGDLAEHGGHRYAERPADGREQLARRFLLTSLDLGEVAEGDAGRGRHLAQRPLLTEPVAPKDVAEQTAEHDHRDPLSKVAGGQRYPSRPTVRDHIPTLV